MTEAKSPREIADSVADKVCRQLGYGPDVERLYKAIADASEQALLSYAAELQAALDKYGSHLTTCAHVKGFQCSCGLSRLSFRPATEGKRDD